MAEPEFTKEDVAGLRLVAGHYRDDADNFEITGVAAIWANDLAGRIERALASPRDEPWKDGPHPLLKRAGRIIREAILAWKYGDEGEWLGDFHYAERILELNLSREDK